MSNILTPAQLEQLETKFKQVFKENQISYRNGQVTVGRQQFSIPAPPSRILGERPAKTR